MFDKKDIANIGDEFERILKVGKGNFSPEQIKTLRTAYEVSTAYLLNMLVDRMEGIKLK